MVLPLPSQPASPQGPGLLSTFPPIPFMRTVSDPTSGQVTGTFAFGNSQFAESQKRGTKVSLTALAHHPWSLAGETVCTLITPLGQAHLCLLS